MSIRDSLLAEFDHEMAATRRVLQSVPDDRLTWKPHERSRSAGQLAAHVVDIAGWAPHILDALRFDLDAAPARSPEPVSMAAVLRQFDEGTTRARLLLDRTDGELGAVWSLPMSSTTAASCRCTSA